jgi:hypothetical protein
MKADNPMKAESVVPTELILRAAESYLTGAIGHLLDDSFNPTSEDAVDLLYHWLGAIQDQRKRLVQRLDSDPVHYEGGKWWFWDETWTKAMGPYPSRKQAEGAHRAFMRLK